MRCDDTIRAEDELLESWPTGTWDDAHTPESTEAGECDACGAIAEVVVSGPNGGVIALCADRAACDAAVRAQAGADEDWI